MLGFAALGLAPRLAPGICHPHIPPIHPPSSKFTPSSSFSSKFTSQYILSSKLFWFWFWGRGTAASWCSYSESNHSNLCRVVSSSITDTTPPPIFPVDTRSARWADKVTGEGEGWGRRRGAGKCKFPFTPPPSSPSWPAQLVPWRAIIPIYALICLCRPPHSPLIGRYLPKLAPRKELTSKSATLRLWWS